MLILNTLISEPFVVAFVKTMYTVAECDGQVEVCVNLTRPHTDILDEVVHLDVYRSDSSRHFPSGSGLASKQSFQPMHCPVHTAPQSTSVHRVLDCRVLWV